MPCFTHSSYSQKLASIASQNKDVYMIESLQDLNIHWLKGKRKVAASAGASTPTYLTNQVIEFLIQFDESKEETFIKPPIEKSKILD